MSSNPLAQYFRRPSIYIRLPSGGKYYTTDIVEFPENKELPVYPMTAIDEITARTPDALFNGTALVDIIKSCVPAIKNPWKVNSIDMEALLIAIRVATNGEIMDVGSTCPSCSNEASFNVNLSTLLMDKVDIDYSSILRIRDLEIKFKPLTYNETNQNTMAQYEIQKMLVMLENYEDNEEKQQQMQKAMKKLNEISTDVLVTTIESIKTPETTVTNKEYIKEFLQNCDKKANEAIREKGIELKSKNDLKPLNLKCINCGHEYKQNLVLNITDFFG